MNKKQNVEYWDKIEQSIELFLIELAKNGGSIIHGIELDTVKDVTEYLTNTLEKQIPNCKFPFVNENF